MIYYDIYLKYDYPLTCHWYKILSYTSLIFLIITFIQSCHLIFKNISALTCQRPHNGRNEQTEYFEISKKKIVISKIELNQGYIT